MSSSYFPLHILLWLEKPEAAIHQQFQCELPVLPGETQPILSHWPIWLTRGTRPFNIKVNPVVLSPLPSFQHTQGKHMTHVSRCSLFFLILSVSSQTLDTKQSSWAFLSWSRAFVTKWHKGDTGGFGGQRKHVHMESGLEWALVLCSPQNCLHCQVSGGNAHLNFLPELKHPSISGAGTNHNPVLPSAICQLFCSRVLSLVVLSQLWPPSLMELYLFTGSIVGNDMPFCKNT